MTNTLRNFRCPECGITYHVLLAAETKATLVCRQEGATCEEVPDANAPTIMAEGAAVAEVVDAG